MSIEIRENRYYWEGTEDECFPYPPKGSRLAIWDDFILYCNNVRRFRAGVIFYAVNQFGFFDKYFTSPTSSQKDLANAIVAKTIYIKKN